MNSKHDSQHFRNFLVAFASSCLVALVLMVVQVPQWLFYLWPDWVALVVIYWALSQPQRVGPVVGFMVGTILEVLFVRKFGVLGFGFAVLAFAANAASQQLRMMSLWQQSLIVGLLMLVFKVVTGWLYGIVSDFSITQDYWISLIGNVFLWPFIYISLQEYSRVFRLR